MTPPLTPAELLAAMERCRRATPGEWQHVRDANGVDSMIVQPRPDMGKDESIVICGSVAAPFSDNFDDGDFIASARTDIPAQLALIAELLDVIAGVYFDAESNKQDRIDKLRGLGEFITPEWREAARKLKEAR